MQNSNFKNWRGERQETAALESAFETGVNRSDNDKLRLWKQNLYREKIVIEENAEDAWVRGGIPMSLI